VPLISSFNFKYINFNGSFSNFNIYHNGYTNWAFELKDTISTTAGKNSFLNVYNNNLNDPLYVFYNYSYPPYIDLTNSVASIGHLNTVTPQAYVTNSLMYYCGVSDLINYTLYYNLNSPINNSYSYLLNFYSPSTR